MKLPQSFHLKSVVLSTMLAMSGIAYAEAPTASNDKPVTEQLVDTMTKLAGGPHAGYRANHAKGILVKGEFTPAKTAAGLSKAIHLQTSKSPVIVRFSNATGIPTIADANGNAFPKGIAIRFMLPDNAHTDIVSISTNGFPAATPEDFLGLLNAVAASKPESKKPTPVEQFLAAHPAAERFVKMPKPAPTSFATEAFYGVNAFKFTNAKGDVTYARYRLTPVKGAQFLSAEQSANAAPNYLMDELPVRLANKPVQFELSAQIAEKNDNVNDATAVWPEGRKQILLGTLTLTAIAPDGAKFAKANMFNPLTLVNGIEPSADPILLARPGAYAVSYSRRLGQ
jgi:catalase